MSSPDPARGLTASAFAACEALVRRHDPDRYFAALFAPERRHLFALYAFNHELAHVGESVREPLVAEIRLTWWRDTLEEARAGRPKNHHVTMALAATLAARDLPQAWFERMIAARLGDVSPEPFADIAAVEAYADATSATLMRLAAATLGAGNEALAREAGMAFALTGLIRAAPFQARRGRRHLSDGLRKDAAAAARLHFEAARATAPDRAGLPAYLPAALVPLYLRRQDPPLWRKQIVYLRAAVTGRL